MENYREMISQLIWATWKTTVQPKNIKSNETVQLMDKPYLITMKHFDDSFAKHQSHPKMKKFHVSNIKRLPSPIEEVILGASTKTKTSEGKNGIKKREEIYRYKAKTGNYLIEFSEKGKVVGHAVYGAWLYGERGEMADMLLISPDNYTKLISSIVMESVKKEIPKKGVFSATFNSDHGINIYKDIAKEMRGAEVIHNKIPSIKRDVNFFFDNIDRFTDYNLPGQRKILVAGEPGTGKSSLAMQIATEHAETHSVIFFTDMQSLYVHTQLCAKHGVPTICILEDCERELQRAHSSVLNFLNGVGQPVNPNGCYVIFTTNHPSSIEGRIKKRPGRIDKIFFVGALNGKDADQVTQMYFARFLEEDFNFDKLNNTLRGLTGAQIKSIATATLQLSLEVAALMSEGKTLDEVIALKVDLFEKDSKIKKVRKKWDQWADTMYTKMIDINENLEEGQTPTITIDDVINKQFIDLLREDLRDQYKQLDDMDKGPESLELAMNSKSQIKW